MSTIVVVRKKKQACIAADSVTSFGDTLLPADFDQASDKITYHLGNYIGTVGSAAHQLVLESALHSMRQVDLHTRQSIFESYRRLHRTLKDDYYLKPAEDEEDPYESSRMDSLILNDSGIFGVYGMREVFEYSRFWAIGSGADYALGAMQAIYEYSDSAIEIARAGINAAAKFDNSSSLPMTLYSVSMDYTDTMGMERFGQR